MNTNPKIDGLNKEIEMPLGNTECTSGFAEVPSEQIKNLISYQYKGWIKGPRFAHIPELLKILAWELDCTIKMDISKRLLRETILFDIRGPHSQVKKFMDRLNKAVRNYER